jgi:hypothetical protein
MHILFAHRPSAAMVVACIALAVALGGTSVAAVNAIAPNTIGPAQIRADAVSTSELRNGSVTTRKLHDNAVTGPKVLNRSLTAADFVPGSLPRGPAGAAGPASPAGPSGPAGPAGTIGAITVRQGGVTVAGGSGAAVQDGAYDTGTVSVSCNPGEKAISAGTGWSDDAADRELWTQRITPLLTDGVVTGYRGTGGNDSGNTSTFTLYVLCY